MLALARKKAPRMRFEWGNALELPYADDEFDAATVGFGARNFSDLDRGLSEMTRVVKPGGRVVILEMTTPHKPPLSTFFRLWFDRVVPLLGKVAGDPDAYDYLPNSRQALPGPGGPGGGDGARRAAADPLDPDRRRDHRDARRRQARGADPHVAQRHAPEP